MAEAKDCPRCKLVNPPEAVRCDCGYDFVAKQFVGTLLPSVASRSGYDSGSALLLGFLLVSVGVLIGGAVGIPVRVWFAGSGPDGCGLWVLPVMLEGLLCGATLGGLLGAITTALVALRWRHAT